MNEDSEMDICVVRETYTYNEKRIKKEREVTVENAYDVLKNSLNIEQHNTHNPIGIINETIGKVIFYNIEQIIFIESRKRIKQNKKCKYENIPNNKYIINLLHHNDFIVSFKMNSMDKIVEKSISAGTKERISIRKERHYKREINFLVVYRKQGIE